MLTYPAINSGRKPTRNLDSLNQALVGDVTNLGSRDNLPAKVLEHFNETIDGVDEKDFLCHGFVNLSDLFERVLP